VPVIPTLRSNDRFHICDTLHGFTMAVGPVKAEGRAPVMNNQGDPLAHIQGLEKGVEKAAVIDEAIRAGATARQLAGGTPTDQVGCDTAASVAQVRQHVSP